jgi:ribonuclease G
MTKEMIISSSAHETRVAILEDDQVAEIFIERERQRGVVGNLYKGRVSKVLPGMQSAFVDLGLERDGFLYVSDVADTFDELDKFESDEDEPVSAAPNGAARPASAAIARLRRGPPPPRLRRGKQDERRAIATAIRSGPSRRSKSS